MAQTLGVSAILSVAAYLWEHFANFHHYCLSAHPRKWRCGRLHAFSITEYCVFPEAEGVSFRYCAEWEV
jgi:hypothetical protein